MDFWSVSTNPTLVWQMVLYFDSVFRDETPNIPVAFKQLAAKKTILSASATYFLQYQNDNRALKIVECRLITFCKSSNVAKARFGLVFSFRPLKQTGNFWVKYNKVH